MTTVTSSPSVSVLGDVWPSDRKHVECVSDTDSELTGNEVVPDG